MNDNPPINYYSKEVYGQTLYYFANTHDALAWYQLTGHKTITTHHMEYMKALTGCTFDRVFGPEAA